MIIGIVGKAGAGKDTVADYLVEKYNFRKFAFADKLKEIAKDLFNVNKKDEDGRYILQQLGSKMREIQENIWIDYVFRQIEEENAVISDVRYVNEAQRIIDEGGVLILLHVSDNIRKSRIEKRDGRKISSAEFNKFSQHSSEKEFDRICNERLIIGEVFNIIIGDFNVTKEDVYPVIDDIISLI